MGGGSQSLHTVKNLCTVGEVLTVAKSVGDPGTCAVVAAGKAGWGLIVPVAVERDIPSELAPKLDVVSDINIGVDTPGIGKGRQNSRDDVEVGPVETEQTHLPNN